MAPDLPYELHALICSHFDAPTLQTYSLICHQFHSFAQQIIFSKIKVVFPRLIMRENNRTESFLRLTESSPQICDSVRSVSLTHKIVQPFKHRMSYLWDDPIVVSLLLRLQNVKKFSMEGRALNFLHWASILPPVQEALTGVCHSNVLTNLALFHIINLPLDVLDGCVALQELSLDLITFESKEMMRFLTDAWKPATPRERRTQLKSLHLAVLHLHFLFFSMWITSSVCSLDITNLRRFSLSLIEEYTDPKTLKVILQPCAKTLEIFCFDPAFGSNRDKNVTPNPVDISRLTSLRILRLRLISRSRTHTLRSYFQWTFNLLNQLPPTNTVAEISIKVSLIKERIISGAQGAIDMAIWCPLDALLASHASDSLRQYKFIALEEEFDRPNDAGIIIEQTFPRLEEAKVLSVQMANVSENFLCGPDYKEDIFARVKVH
ncbi:hypothetical protein BJ912DRAFT_964594 [Pholiota molesta]|nr:hypothetical protein BJ912DRAFT_964594 [Pholiota molesta]